MSNTTAKIYAPTSLTLEEYSESFRRIFGHSFPAGSDGKRTLVKAMTKYMYEGIEAGKYVITNMENHLDKCDLCGALVNSYEMSYLYKTEEYVCQDEDCLKFVTDDDF